MNNTYFRMDNIFNFFYNQLENINFNDLETSTKILNIIFMSLINIIYSLNKITKLLTTCIDKYNKNKETYIIKLNDLNNNINIIESNILKNYYKFLNLNNNKKILKIDLVHNNKEYNNKYNINDNNSNLNILEFDDNNLNNKIINNNNKNNIIFDNDPNYIGFEMVNIGFDNYYQLHVFNKLDDNLPFNLLIYMKELNQVIIKIGTKNKYRYINSKLYKTYLNKTDDNCTSILCNNNIKELKKKCFNNKCKYYHDYILGYEENYHKDRKFSNNPIVYNCLDFKDGSKTKEYTKKIKWYESINLYQSSLSTILIGCIHSLNESK